MSLLGSGVVSLGIFCGSVNGVVLELFRMVNAATGTGKTVAYLAPIVHFLQGYDGKIQRSDGTFGELSLSFIGFYQWRLILKFFGNRLFASSCWNVYEWLRHPEESVSVMESTEELLISRG